MPSLVQHLHVTAATPSSAGLSVLATVTVYVAVAGTGLLAAPMVTGLDTRSRWRRIVIGALVGGYAALLVVLATAGQAHAPAAAAALSLAGLAASTIVLTPRVQLLGAAALGASQLVTTYDGIAHTLVLLPHLFAAAVWMGGVAHLAAFGIARRERPRLGRAVRRFTPYAVASATTLPITGVALLIVRHLSAADLVSSAFGNVVLIKSALLATAAALGLGHRSGWPWRRLVIRRELLRVEAGMLAGALGFAAVLTGTALPARAVQSTAPGVAVVDLGGGQTVTVFLTRMAPSSALVRLLSGWQIQFADRIAHTVRQLAPGGVARVQLHNGTALLALSSGAVTRNVSLTAPSHAGVGSLDYQLGRSLALAGASGSGASPVCPPPATGAESVALGRSLRSQGVHRVDIVGGGPRRGQELVRGLRLAGVRETPDASNVVVATSRTRARRVLRDLAGRPRVTAIYLAPWLLDATILDLLPTLRLPPVTVATSADVMSPLADRYRATLAAFADGVGPSIDGLRGYESVAAPRQQEADLTLYAAAPVGFLPGVLDEGHQHDAPGWFPSGTLVPVSAAAPVRTSACPPPTT